MKILITSDFYLPIISGVANVIIGLKKQLELLGHDVRILTFIKNKKSYYDETNKVYFFRSLFFQFYKDSLNGINIYNPLMKEIYSWSPDLIHSQTEFFSMRFAKKISKVINIPIVHTWHTDFSSHYPNFKLMKCTYELILRIILNKSLQAPVVRIICPSIKTTQMINSFNIKLPISVLPSGINLNHFTAKIPQKEINEIFKKNNINKEYFRLIILSRLAKEKRIDKLIIYFSKLKKLHNNIQLLIVGDGPVKKNLENLTHELNLENDIKFCGSVVPEVVNKYYKCSNIFISASQSETQGLTYYEALASGIPIVCKNDIVLNDLLINGHNGYSFDTEEDFLEIFNKLLKNKDLYEKIQNNTTKSVEKYSAENSINKLVSIYNDCLLNSK